MTDAKVMKARGVGIGLLVFLLFAGMMYGFYGHALIRAVYEGRSFAILNSLIEGRSQFSLESYLDWGDGVLFTFSILCLLLFLFFILKDRPLTLSKTGEWGIAGGAALLVLALVYFRPVFTENELVYLIRPRKLLNPGYLAEDWSWAQGDSSRLVFNLLLSPFTLFLNDLTIALAGRLLVWTLLLGALIKLVKTLEMRGWEFVLGFFLWIYAGQSIAAGEWVFGGLEAKCFSFALLFLGLASILEGRLTRAGIYAGLSMAFHVLVGGWGGGALFVLGLALCLKKETNFRGLVLFSVFFILIGMAGILPAAYNLLGAGPMTEDHYRADVLFRGAHHMDPFSFLSPSVLRDLVLFLPLTLTAVLLALKRREARALLIFLAVLFGVFMAGIGARQLQAYPFLYLYPFRLFPVFLPLFFYLAAPRAAALVAKPADRGKKFLAAAVCLLLVFQGIRYEMPFAFLKTGADTFASWKHFILGKQDAFDEMALWIWTHTPPGRVFVAPPWEYRFWLLTGRPQIVSYKYIPASHSNLEWLARLRVLNGDRDFKTSGGGPLKELKQNYPELTAEQLWKLHEKYSVAYYLTPKKRGDLPFSLVYSNDSYFLYEIRGASS